MELLKIRAKLEPPKGNQQHADIPFRIDDGRFAPLILVFPGLVGPTQHSQSPAVGALKQKRQPCRTHCKKRSGCSDGLFPSQSLKTCCIPGFGVREPVVIRRIYFEALSLQEFIAT